MSVIHDCEAVWLRCLWAKVHGAQAKFAYEEAGASEVRVRHWFSKGTTRRGWAAYAPVLQTQLVTSEGAQTENSFSRVPFLASNPAKSSLEPPGTVLSRENCVC